MLTEKCKEWLEGRKYTIHKCRNCTHLDGDKTFCQYVPPFPGGWCYLDDTNQDWRDSTEFEAKVAAKMTRVTVGDLPCGVDPDNNECQKPHFRKYNNNERAIGCDMCFLMVARLAVEAEE